MMRLSIGQIIASSYIKFDRLTDMVNAAFVNSTATKINLFIDINSCIKQMYSSTFDLTSLEERTEIASCIINMIAHYRRFFRTRYNVECNAHLVYSANNRSENQMFCFEYNKRNADLIRLNPEKTKLLMDNLEILSMICSYLPDTSFTIGTFETAVIMHDIINQVREENVPNIIISRDIYNTQLVAVNDDVIMFRPKKSSNQDASYFIAKGGCIQNLINDRQVNIDTGTNVVGDGLLSFIMALSKLPERNIKSLLSLPKAYILTSEAIKTGMILNGYNHDISSIYNLFPDADKARCIHGNIDSRFKAIDIIYQYAIYLSSPERHNFKGMKNLYDPKSVHKICNEYFKTNPLNLENL